MGFQERHILPEDCDLRRHFPGGEVYVQTSGATGVDGPTNVNLYDVSFEVVPRVPVLHVTVESSAAVATQKIELGLAEAHRDGVCRSLGCEALRAVRTVPHEDMPGVHMPEVSVVR